MTKRPTTQAVQRALEAAALAALLLLAAGYYAQPVADVDSWWHLASGRHIVASGAVPDTDPFGMYDAANYWAQTVLKGQWLGQVTLYGAYAVAGLDGVVALRASLLVACVGIAWLRMRREGAASAPALAILFVLVMMLRGHLGERPQLFSFVLFGLAFLLVEHASVAERSRWFLALPALILVWANCHPGVILGVIALSVWLLLGIAEQWWRTKAVDARRWGVPATAVAGSWLATLATPNGLTSYEYLLRLEGDPLKDRVSEYQSPLALAEQLHLAPSLPWYFALALVSLGAITVLLWRRRLRSAGLVALLLGVSLSSYRYIPFFALYAAPFLAYGVGELIDSSKRWARPVALATLAGAAALLAYGLGQGAVFRGGMAERLYPVEMVRGMEQAGVRGRAFNSLNWGGYLNWRLGPAVTPFIDGRMMEPGRVRPYTHILWMTPEGRDSFEGAGFDLVLIPHRNAFDPAQAPYPLVAYLSNHPQWRLAARDGKGVLFLRR